MHDGLVSNFKFQKANPVMKATKKRRMRLLWLTWSSKAHAINVEELDTKRQIAKQIRRSSSMEPAISATRKVIWRRIALKKKKMQASSPRIGNQG